MNKRSVPERRALVPQRELGLVRLFVCAADDLPRLEVLGGRFVLLSLHRPHDRTPRGYALSTQIAGTPGIYGKTGGPLFPGGPPKRVRSGRSRRSGCESTKPLKEVVSGDSLGLRDPLLRSVRRAHPLEP